MNEKKKFLELIGIITIFLGIFFIISVIYSPLIDENALVFSENSQNYFIYYFMQIITFLGSIEFLIILFAIIMILAYMKKKDSLKRADIYLIGVGATYLISYIIKIIVKRERPFNILETGFSFPSGHSSASMTAYAILALFLWKKNKKLSFALLLIPFLVGFSRIYLMVHWLSDVSAGLFLGAVIAFFTIWIFYDEYSSNKRELKKTGSPRRVR